MILGKSHAIKLSLATLLASGHLLITDRPGVGKTTLAHTLATLIGLDFKRIQFTSDLLPADITGVHIFEPDAGKFTLHRGPVFANIVLADEINRATPKCQSALLEAMQERSVSIDRTTYQLPAPFFVIATRNPDEQLGTFPLPESQLDRFTLDIQLGYPSSSAERQLLTKASTATKYVERKQALKQDELQQLQREALSVAVSEAFLDYLQEVIAFTRTNDAFESGFSPRAGLSLLAAAKSWAFIHHRNFVIPEDLQVLLPHTMHHLRPSQQQGNLAQYIVENVAVS